MKDKINSKINNTLEEYTFINIENDSNFLLDDISLNIPLSTTFLDLDTTNIVINALSNEISRNVIKKCISIDGEDIQLDVDNRSINHFIESIMEIVNENSNSDNTPIIVNVLLGAIFMDHRSFQVLPSNILLNNGLLYKIGSIYGRDVYVDPYIRWNDKFVIVLNSVELKYSESIITSIENGTINYSFNVVNETFVIRVNDPLNVLI